MDNKNFASEVMLASAQYGKEEAYWIKQLGGELNKCSFTADRKKAETGTLSEVSVNLDHELAARLLKISNNSDTRLHLILAAGVSALLFKYTGMNDVIIGTPIYRQEAEGSFVNTVLPLRSRLDVKMSFKELLIQLRETMIQAEEHQNYPLALLPKVLNLPELEGEFSLFSIAVLLENVQERKYLAGVKPELLFAFKREGEGIGLTAIYEEGLFEEETVQRICRHLTYFLSCAVNAPEASLEETAMLPPEEKQALLDFNKFTLPYPEGLTVHSLFEEQAVRTPDNLAVIYQHEQITYRALNEKANQLARFLQKNGVVKETVVGIMLERSIDMVIGLLGILKAGGAYLPIEPGTPEDRVLYMLEDAGARLVLTSSGSSKNLSFTALMNFAAINDLEIVVTAPRQHIKEFDSLPKPDRSFLDLQKYKNKIGMASVTNCISIQTTRGCPYKCLYCHKIWSKHHVHRSAENIFDEVSYYYQNGVTNFAFIDDCFNLDVENSSRFFKLLIANKLKVQLFFPNGLRGDILTPDYIDLMVEAGTRGVNLSLETASPRLQKLLLKNLDLEKFKNVVDYIAGKHPEIILEIATMHGFPTETEEEAMLTLNFIKNVKWLHFPYIHILKIFPNTEMEEFALSHGISKEAIMVSKNRAFHELPETLPFPKSFTRKYQASFLNEYFLLKERLRQVLPVQMRILSEEALVQKYNAYLPVEIKSIKDIIDFAQLGEMDLPEFAAKKDQLTIFDRGRTVPTPGVEAKKVLLLDLSQHFSSHSMLYKVTEQPLGLMYLATYLREKFGEKISSRVYKSGNDFDNFAELKQIIEEYKPDMIGIRTLTFFKEFFHETVSLLRQWGVNVPIITGGPYAASDFDTILKDKNVNLVVFGEGEYTLGELIEKMLQNGFKLPDASILREIPGLAFAGAKSEQARQVVLVDEMYDLLEKESRENLGVEVVGTNLAYVMYTSGSTGKPKGVMVEHTQVNNCIFWMQHEYPLQAKDIILQRTNLTFDPSVWEIFWPLYVGGAVRVLSAYESKDADYLLNLLTENQEFTAMYCPATLVSAMIYLLQKREVKPKLRLPLFFIGAEPIAMETVQELYTYLEGRVINTYGPTECTINNTFYEIARQDARTVVPIGQPVANNQLYILTAKLELLPEKTAGEICIAGKSVARGYINNPAKTAAVFVENPFGPGKLYKTGDVGRFLPDGTIEILGRVDEQVKVRGYRIEPGEIESALSSYAGITDCIVIVKDSKSADAEIKTCKLCGITSAYPGVKINDEGVCETCLNIDKYKEAAANYFKNLDELAEIIREKNIEKSSKYDCLLLYSGGRGSAYALYHLVEMGFNVLAFTYDNGYFAKSDLENIKKITASLGVDHVCLTHPRSDAILCESLKVANTVCRGCFHTSSSLAGDYALSNNIKVVVGATLSRGQIMENKLNMFIVQGITDQRGLEKEAANLQRIAPDIDKNIFAEIGIASVESRIVYDRIKFVDFYRFCDVTNAEIISYLNNRDPYWKKRKNYAIYSTNCPIKQIGDFGHLQAAGFHYYGSATSWEKRFGHLTLENVKEDLTCYATKSGYQNFIKRVGFVDVKAAEKKEKYLCAYYTAEKELDITELREHLKKHLPEYMIPAYFTQIPAIPLTSSGKIDKKALPLPDKSRAKFTATFVEPGSDVEKLIAGVWSETLKLDKVGLNDNFFDLGGSSLDIIQTGSKLKEIFKQDISVVTLFTYPTVGALAEFLSAEAAATGETDRKESIEQGKNRRRQQIEKRKGGS